MTSAKHLFAAVAALLVTAATFQQVTAVPAAQSAPASAARLLA